jgi:uncharacterized membrane protein
MAAPFRQQGLVNMNSHHPLTGYVHAMYALHAFAGFIGVTSGATIIGAFVFGLPSILAIIMNYARRDAVRGSWIESHFEWQRRTFWSAVAIGVVIILVAVALSFMGMLSLASTPVTGGVGAAGAAASFAGAWLAFALGAIAAGIWILYRVARGWLALGRDQPVPAR